MKICRSPSAFSTRRLISAIRSFEPGGGRLLQNFAHSSSAARSANDEDGITNGPRVTDGDPALEDRDQPGGRADFQQEGRGEKPAAPDQRCVGIDPLFQRLDHAGLPVLDPAQRRMRQPVLPAMMGGMGARVNRLEPGADQHQIGRAGAQQRHRQRDRQVLAGGLEDRSHHGRKHRAILARESRRNIFCADSGLVYDSGTPAKTATNPARSAPILASVARAWHTWP